MRSFLLGFARLGGAPAFALLALLLTSVASAQSSRPSYERSRTGRSTRKPELTAAQRAADEKVSFSADTIIGILRDEAGLRLQIKKALVEKAYEQGRILDPIELTDEVLFRLLREDDNIRIIATREIENRGYIRVKPTLDEQREQLEMERRWREQSRLGTAKGPAEAETQEAAPPKEQEQPSRRSQEDSYYNRHEPVPVVPPYDRGINPPGTQDEQNQPGIYDQQRQPQRRVQRAMVESDTSRMAQVRPDELPELLSGDTASRIAPTAGRERQSLSPDVGNLPQQPMRPDQLGSRQAENPTEEARFDNRARETFAPARRPVYQQPAIRHRPNPYADVPLLYDLYTQVAAKPPIPDRFGADIFRNGTGNIDQLPMDLPVGPDYVLGPGDTVTVELWGGISQRLRRVVDPEGRIALPEVGTVLVSGKTLGYVQQQVQSVLRTQFRDVQADISLGRVRTVRVYVVGDVQYPGAYDVSSLSTPLNAVFTAGGPTDRGSIRTVKHFRGKQLVQTVDVYDLILHGVRSDVQPIQSGDTILVPPLGPQVTVEGTVRRPAVYEIAAENNLADVLEMAGGVLTTGTLRRIEVERIQAHESRRMLSLDLPDTNDRLAVLTAMEQFKVQDGDKIRIASILPYAQNTVYLDGHVFHPGKYAYKEGMKLTDLIGSSKDLLPEPSTRHAEIIRLNPNDFAPTVLAFNLGDVLSGKAEAPVLKPLDTVRIFGRYDFEDPPRITISGEVRDPGDHLTNGETHVRDAVYLAGGTTPDAQLAEAQVLRKDGNSLKVISVDLAKALAGDPVQNVLLKSTDRLVVHRDLAKLDPPRIIIAGEVAKPGKYPLGENMTVSDLVHVAGGLKRGTYTQSADLSRYVLQNGSKVLGGHEEIALAKALSGDADSDIALRDGDVVTIRQLSGWTDIGATIAVKGEVVHPGTYGIRDGERLSSVLERAGGFRGGAYPYGAVLFRAQVRDLEEQNQSDMIRSIEAQQNGLKLISDTDPEQKKAKDAALQQWQVTLRKLRDTPPQGRLVIHISSDIGRWKNSADDIEVRAGDTLIIPKRAMFVSVLGQVFNPTAVTFRPGKSASWYLEQAGGPTTTANKKAIFVIRADGSVIGGTSGGFFKGNALSATLQAGDTVVVPERAIGGPKNWQTLLQTAQVLSSIAVTAVIMASNL